MTRRRRCSGPASRCSASASRRSATSSSHHARHYLVELAERFTVVAGITARDGLRMRILDRHEAINAVLSYNARVGGTLPMATTASGWAYLASLDDAGRDRLVDQIAREQPNLWELARPSINKALVRFRREGVIVARAPSSAASPPSPFPSCRRGPRPPIPSIARRSAAHCPSRSSRRSSRLP